MNIQIKIETHAYVGEKLCDEILDSSLHDDIISCGSAGPGVIIPLRENRRCVLLFNYTHQTTLREVIYAILKRVDSLNHGIQVAFLYENSKYWVENENANFLTILKKCIDPQKTGSISVEVFVSLDSGVIEEENGIRYYMNSRERGKHHEPHVHVCDTSHNYEAVILIRNGQIIGNFPSKLAKKAKNKILSNQEFFLTQWNVLTDGLYVDINKFLSQQINNGGEHK